MTTLNLLHELQALVDESADSLHGVFHIKICGITQRLFESIRNNDGDDGDDVVDEDDEDDEDSLDNNVSFQLDRLFNGDRWYEKEHAAFCLANLADDDEHYQRVIAAAGAIPPLVAMVCDGVGEQKLNAARALANLACLDTNRELIAVAGGIPALVALLRDNTAPQENATIALSILSTNQAIRESIASDWHDAIPPLVWRLSNGTEKQKYYCIEVLSNLSINNPTNREAITRAGGVPALVALSQNGEEDTKDAAVQLLCRYEFAHIWKSLKRQRGPLD